MKILVGFSGGVDSAYTVHLLKSAGYDVECAILVMHEFTELDMAQNLALELGVKLHTVDCSERFSKIVKENFTSEYMRGRTPNPCIICNEQVKFKCLYDYAIKNGFDRIATGHYARLYKVTDSGYEPYDALRGYDSEAQVRVGVAADITKDQSYMLWRVPEHILRSLVLPLAEVEKLTIKENAVRLSPSLSGKRESQEICFIKDGSYADYIEAKCGKSPEGDFVDTEGNKLGRHSGIIRYTVGQRKGLGISAGGRLFVTKIDAAKNEITLSLEDKYYSKVRISDVILHGRDSLDNSLYCSVKLRYAAKPIVARLDYTSGEFLLHLNTPVRAVTAGQSAVLYDNGVVIGGGIIESAE